MDKLSMYIGTLNNANTKRNYGNDIRFMLEYVGKDEKDITLELRGSKNQRILYRGIDF